MSSTRSTTKSRLPPLKALLAFEAASRKGSFALGAEELAVTPSAVSHHIQQLEDFLGVPLFQRHPGRAVLTAAGRSYAREIERAFGVIADATNLVAPQSQRGYLVVASGPSFATKWLQPRLPEFLRANPEIRIRLSTLSDHDDLETTRFDIAIAYGYPHTSKLDVEPLLVERLRPLCSPALATTLALKNPRDLLRATLIHSSNGLTWSEYLRRVCDEEVRPDNELWLDRSVMAIEAAVDGLGVVLESEVLAAEELSDGRLIAPFDDARFSIDVTSYYLVRSGGYNTSSQAATTFESWLRSAFQCGEPDVKIGWSVSRAEWVLCGHLPFQQRFKTCA